jgi:ribosomal protein L24
MKLTDIFKQMETSDIKPGDKVRIKTGEWQGRKGKVVRFSKSRGTGMTVMVELETNITNGQQFGALKGIDISNLDILKEVK